MATCSYFSPLMKSITNRGETDYAMIEEDLEERDDFISTLESRFLYLAADARSTLRFQNGKLRFMPSPYCLVLKFHATVALLGYLIWLIQELFYSNSSFLCEFHFNYMSLFHMLFLEGVGDHLIEMSCLQ